MGSVRIVLRVQGPAWESENTAGFEAPDPVPVLGGTWMLIPLPRCIPNERLSPSHIWSTGPSPGAVKE